MTEFMGLAEKVSKFNQQALKHIENQTLNPFSGRFSRSPSPRPKFNKDEYGKPAAGSLTEMRGQRAFSQISREILELCEVIHDMGARRKDDDGDECIIIPFGELFAFYTKISDKVVGLLIAAKKRGFVFFEPEILFQRRDDDVLIALLMPIGEIRNVINRQISASPSPAPTSSSEEKTSPCPTPSPLAKQNNSTLPEAPSTPAKAEIRDASPVPAKPSEEQQTASSSKEENVSHETPATTVTAAESAQTTPSSELLSPIEEEQKSSSEVPVVESEQAPIPEVPAELEKSEVVEVIVAEPPVEIQDNSPLTEPALPSEGVETSPSTALSEKEQISQPSESTTSTDEEKTCTETATVPEEQAPLKPTEEEEASLKITIYQVVNEPDQPTTVSTSAETDLVSSSGESEQTTLTPEAQAPADENTSSVTQIAPDENEKTSTSPVTSVEPEQSLPSSDKSDEVIPSNEKEETLPSNDTGEKTLA